MSSTEAESPAPAIELEHVVKRYGKRTVLDDVSLRIAPGELVALGGRSGVGKSTLMQLIGALDTVDSGRIMVAGQEIGHHFHAARFRREVVGLVFQLHNLVPRLTAQQNVELAMFGTGISGRLRHERAVELLAQVGLADYAKSRPPMMSGGERQRVAIARALANHPRVILADEPIGNLDDESAGWVLDLFRRLVDESVTVLAVSHDERLDRLADRRLELVDGKVNEVSSNVIG